MSIKAIRIKTRFIRMVLLVVGITIALVASAQTCPTALNLIPTAEVMESGSFCLGYESDGKRQPFDAGRTMYTFTEFGIGGRAEAGVDFCDLTNESTGAFNAKILLSGESAKMPATALGVLNLGDNSDPGYYLVGTKSFDKTSLHAGMQTQGGSNWGLLGARYAASKSVSLALDWQTGPGQGHTAGIAWQATPAMGLMLYYVSNNTAELRETDDYVGLYVGYSFNCGK